MRDNPFESAAQLRMRAAFEKAVREKSYLAANDPHRRKLEARIDKTIEKARAHLARHSPAWVAKENARLVQKHKGQLKPQLSPKWVLRTETSPAAIARQAFRNVDERNAARLRKIDAIATRMRARLENGLENNSPRNRTGMRI